MENPSVNLPQADSNWDTERLWAYHEATKHSYWSVRSRPHYLDWQNQPNPFRIYSGAPILPLSPKPTLPDISTFSVLADLTQPPTSPVPAPITPLLISQLFYHSMAISAWKQVRGTDYRYSLRVNPSSGNLHPTETYLILQNSSDLSEGLYHYQVPGHGLELRHAGPILPALTDVVPSPWIASAPLIIVLNSIFWRESWKYQERAYRYCLLDMGHAAASILLAARALGINGLCLGHFADEGLAQLLGTDVLNESPLLILPLGSRPGSQVSLPAHRPSPGPLVGKPNQLSKEEVPYYLLLGMHQSTFLASPIDSCPKIQAPALPAASKSNLDLPSKPPRDELFGRVVRKRRSALDFDPAATMTAKDLGAILLHASVGFRADFRDNLLGGHVVDLVRLYLYIHRVKGVEQGVYRYHPFVHQLEPLKKGNQELKAARLSLEQELAGHACVTMSMIADLERAAQVFGNRGYRYIHFEAGFIGQLLYISAEAVGFNATGMGAFYDDEVHGYLGLSPKEGQVVYHFGIGRAVPDDRLVPPEDERLRP